MGGDQEKSIIEKFLEENVLFLGPDPEIMENHRVVPTTPREQRALDKFSDPDEVNLVRHKLQTACNESFDMVEQMGAAPGAKWGDLISGVWTANGDLAMASMGGVLIFSGVLRAQEAECRSVFAAAGLQIERIVRLGKWVTARMRNPK